MMRILHVTGVYRPRVGGIELFVEDLVSRQHDAGHEVDVLTSTPGARPRRRQADAGPEVLRVRNSVFVPPKLAEAYRVIDQGDYDVVHVHLSVVSPFSSAIARYAALKGVPVVNTVHSMWNGREAWVRLTGFLASWKKTPMHWTAVSEVAAEDMRAVLADGTEVDVVPNAVDVEWWRHGGEPTHTGEITLVSVMRMAGRKRPMQLLGTLEEVRRSVPPEIKLRAVLVGDGPLTKRLKAEIEHRGLGSWVILAGRLSRTEIRDLYRSADVYIAPAHQESFGIAALEARAAGLAVVAMSSGGVGEFVRDGVEGVLCRNDGDMAAALTELAIQDQWRAAMRAHNRAVPPRQDWPNTLAEFGRAYLRAGARGVVTVVESDPVNQATPSPIPGQRRVSASRSR